MNHVQAFWKPVGWSSFDVIRKLKRYLRGVKIGHAGTLDPFAEGILIVCFGKSTSRQAELMALPKEYIAEVKLGIATDTLDPEGNIIERAEVPPMSAGLLSSISKRFVGEIEQVPPMYSALKHKGVPLYKLARKGKVVERKARKALIHSIDVSDYSSTSFSMRVVCGKGTYIRSLAYDMATELGTVGYVTKLIRTKVGDFGKENAVTVGEIPVWISSVN